VGLRAQAEPRAPAALWARAERPLRETQLLGGSSGAVGVPCAGAAPFTTSTPATRITVDAGVKGAAWNRFYEKVVASDHANTVLPDEQLQRGSVGHKSVNVSEIHRVIEPFPQQVQLPKQGLIGKCSSPSWL